jgi:hypothetical protein
VVLGGPDFADLLGLAMAHELGHLLLRSGAHSANGIMQAELSRKALRDDARGYLRFDSREAELIRKEISGRMALNRKLRFCGGHRSRDSRDFIRCKIKSGAITAHPLLRRNDNLHGLGDCEAQTYTGGCQPASLAHDRENTNKFDCRGTLISSLRRALRASPMS